MIRVQVKPDYISIKGHASYDVHGKDIVCASVSSIATTTINAITSLKSDTIRCKSSEGLILIDIVDCNDETTKNLLDNMVRMFEELSQDYPKNIKVERE